MVRTIVIPKDTDLHITIGKEYVGKKIEVTYLALDELEPLPIQPKKLSELAGTLSHETVEAMLKYVQESR
jgi:hypothetical protein